MVFVGSLGFLEKYFSMLILGFVLFVSEIYMWVEGMDVWDLVGYMGVSLSGRLDICSFFKGED